MKNILSLILFVLPAFSFAQTATLRAEIPEEIIAGNSYMVQFFAETAEDLQAVRFSQHLPEGFKASVTNAAGGKFKFWFAKQTVSIEWEKVEKGKVQFSYMIYAEPQVRGRFALSGKLEYEIASKKSFVNSKQHIINVLSPDATNKIQELTSELNCTRQQRIAQKEAIITLHIQKNNVKAAARILESIPDNFTAQTLETAGASIKSSAGYIQFNWDTIPVQDDFLVKYKLISEKELEQTAIPIEGIISYQSGSSEYSVSIVEHGIQQMEQSENTANNNTPSVSTGDVFAFFDVPIPDSLKTKEAKVISSDSTATNTDVAINDNKTAKTSNTKKAVKKTLNKQQQQTDNQEDKKKKTTKQKKQKTQKVKKSTTKKKTSKRKTSSKKKKRAVKKTKKTSTKTKLQFKRKTKKSQPAEGITYSVQLISVTEPLDNQYFISIGVSKKVKMEIADGLFKYSCGNFKTYLSAKKYQEKIIAKTKLEGAFVVAYQFNSRISVKKALELSRQKWTD